MYFLILGVILLSVSVDFCIIHALVLLVFLCLLYFFWSVGYHVNVNAVEATFISPFFILVAHNLSLITLHIFLNPPYPHFHLPIFIPTFPYFNFHTPSSPSSYPSPRPTSPPSIQPPNPFPSIPCKPVSFATHFLYHAWPPKLPPKPPLKSQILTYPHA